jgi:hypothetical protein
MLAEPNSRSTWGGSRVGAGRPRQAGSRRARRKALTPAGDLSELVERIRFIHDVARDVSRANVANWKGWKSQELHLHALQCDMDDTILRLAALVDGDSRPFETPEFQNWRDSALRLTSTRRQSRPSCSATIARAAKPTGKTY